MDSVTRFLARAIRCPWCGSARAIQPSRTDRARLECGTCHVLVPLQTPPASAPPVPPFATPSTATAELVARWTETERMRRMLMGRGAFRCDGPGCPALIRVAQGTVPPDWTLDEALGTLLAYCSARCAEPPF